MHLDTETLRLKCFLAVAECQNTKHVLKTVNDSKRSAPSAQKIDEKAENSCPEKDEKYEIDEIGDDEKRFDEMKHRKIVEYGQTVFFESETSAKKVTNN